MRKLLLALLLISSISFGQNYPQAVEGDFVIENFKFSTGETFRKLTQRYRTLG